MPTPVVSETLSGLGAAGEYGIAGLVFLLAVWTLRWTDRHQRGWFTLAKTEVAEQRVQIESLREHNRLCEWRTEVLLGVLRRAGLDVPAAYWYPPAGHPDGSHADGG